MKGQNRSSAVMQQRKSPLDALDYFPTPPWATRALCEFLQSQGQGLHRMVCREPACGEGHMARPLFEYFGDVEASDIHDYGKGYRVADFLPQPLLQDAPRHRVPWIITNPPFNEVAAFLKVALEEAEIGVALLVRVAWLEGKDRYETLFAHPHLRPNYWLQFSERVLMLEGRLVRYGAIDPKTGKEVTSATAYGWAVWFINPAARSPDLWPRLRWIAPCRLRLERPGDYPIYPEGAFA